MDNLGIWIVVLILAYAVLHLWLWTEKRLKQHVVHIDKLLNQVEHLEETVFEEEIENQKKLEAIETKALEKFGVKSSQELEGDKRKEYFDYVDTTWRDWLLNKSNKQSND